MTQWTDYYRLQLVSHVPPIALHIHYTRHDLLVKPEARVLLAAAQTTAEGIAERVPIEDIYRTMAIFVTVRLRDPKPSIPFGPFLVSDEVNLENQSVIYLSYFTEVTQAIPAANPDAGDEIIAHVDVKRYVLSWNELKLIARENDIHRFNTPVIDRVDRRVFIDTSNSPKKS